MSICPFARLNKSSAVAEMGDRLTTIDMGRKVGAAVLLSVGELGPHLTQCCRGRGLLRTKWRLGAPNRLTTTDIGRG